MTPRQYLVQIAWEGKDTVRHVDTTRREGANIIEAIIDAMTDLLTDRESPVPIRRVKALAHRGCVIHVTRLPRLRARKESA
ncbi:MAG: hypothetical protein WAN24_12320 [Candidatus Acidiferrales bacterium]